MNPTNEQELDEVLRNLYNIGRHEESGGSTDRELAFNEAKQAIEAHTNAEIAKAKLEAFDVAFDCHDYDRLRAYRAELLKEVK